MQNPTLREFKARIEKHRSRANDKIAQEIRSQCAEILVAYPELHGFRHYRHQVCFTAANGNRIPRTQLPRIAVEFMDWFYMRVTVDLDLGARRFNMSRDAACAKLSGKATLVAH